MKLIRFVPAPDGGSQFVEVDIPIDNASTDAFGRVIRRSAILTAQSTMLGEMPEGLNQDWHAASRRACCSCTCRPRRISAFKAFAIACGREGGKNGSAGADCLSRRGKCQTALFARRAGPHQARRSYSSANLTNDQTITYML